jgi:PhnB protein
MQALRPYLLFNGNCQEALEFYAEHLNGKILFSQKYGEGPLEIREEDKNKVMHATFEFWGGQFMASDNVSGAEWTEEKSTNSNVQLSLGFTDAAEEERIFKAFAEGGEVSMPLQETFWGDYFGMVKDKFGISWMFNGRKEKA